jgi:putative protease
MAQRKPELLLPAGNVDSFYAALEGGADAVYLGLRNFNARGRAGNFSESYLLAALQEARKRKVKLYVTLNTVIKNTEIDSLLDVLSFLEQGGVDAIIVQDWGLYHLARRWFPKLAIHASTQMGNHNSAGVHFSAEKGIARVILARELTMKELEGIAAKAKTELELFIHGALCYSFSGMCFFSSYIGGRGANRGLCAQPCRMVYKDGGQQKYLFSLKDNQQLANLEKLMALGIHSLKVEGRMKPADYVYRVAKAYRMAIDHPEKKQEAEELLSLDFGREKTSYFMGKDVKNAIADSSNTGIPIGFVQQVSQSEVVFESETELVEGDRIRIRNVRNESTFNLRLQDLKVEGNRYSFTYDSQETVRSGDEIFWVGRKAKALPAKFRKPPQVRYKRLSMEEKKRIRQALIVKSVNSKPRLFVRFDDPQWLPLLRMEDVDVIVLSFTWKELESFNFSDQIIQQNRNKIHIELPKFISEEHLSSYKLLLKKLEEQGLRQFFVSHLSQKLLLGKSSTVSTNENVYVYNDAAAKMLHENRVQDFCYPLENDFENLRSMQNKQGIVVLHGYPELFFSRMPVSVSNQDKRFSDAQGKTFNKQTKDGMTIVIPEVPFNLFQYKQQLLKEGFSNFMIDLNHEKPSKQTIKKIFEKFRAGEQYQPSGIFNFKKGLQ